MCNAAPSMEAQRSAWQRWGWLLRWLGTAAGIGYIATLIDVDDVRERTGWELHVSPDAAVTDPPTDAELAVLRDLKTRTEAAHGG